MNSKNEIKVKRDVSCTNTLHYSELRGAQPNPLDFRAAMGEIRGKTASLFVSLPHACYSSPVLCQFIFMYVDILIRFNMKRLQKLAHGYITGPNTKKMSDRTRVQCLTAASGCFRAEIQHVTGHMTEYVLIRIHFNTEEAVAERIMHKTSFERQIITQ